MGGTTARNGGASGTAGMVASGGTGGGGAPTAGSSARGGAGGKAGMGGIGGAGTGGGGSPALPSGGVAGSKEDAGSAPDVASGDATPRVDLQPDRSSDVAVDAADDPNTVDVYLIGGQSNATGQGYIKNIPSSLTINTKVQLYHSADINSGGVASTWMTLRPASEGADYCNLGLRFGPELSFGNNIQSFYSNRQIAIIKHAKSGTNLYSQWAPGSSPSDSVHFGPEFKTFVNTVDGGLKALKSRGLKPVIRGMLWQQGEADADDGGQNYGTNLKNFIARVREQWNSPDMLFVYGYVYPASNFGTGRDIVRAAEKNIDQDSGDALATRRAFVVETDDLELRAADPNNCIANDKVHFGTAGQLELGKRMAIKVHDRL
jgi:hypothetical protein